MKKTLSIAIAMAVAGMSSVASAENPMGLEFGADVALTSNYVFRGFSESGEEPSIQGTFSASHGSGIYASLFAASVDNGGYYVGSPTEVTYTLGWGGDVGPVGLDLGLNQYTYPGHVSPDPDTTEFFIGVSKDFGVLSAGLSYAYADDWYNLGDNSYWNLSAEAPVGDFTVFGHYGYTDRDDGAASVNTGEYSDWLIGVSTELGGFGFALTFTDTDDAEDVNATNEDYTAFTISKSL